MLKLTLSRVIKIVLVGVIVLVGAFFLYGPSTPKIAQPAGQEVKSSDKQVIAADSYQAVGLGEAEKNKTIESKPIKAEFQFNAIAPHWKETNASEENRTMEFRTSLDSKTWSPWLEIEATGPLRENDPYPDRLFTETPILMDGEYFQYRISLSRDSLQDPSPRVYDLKVTQIDSRQPAKSEKVGIVEKLKGLFESETAHAARQHPKIITRSEWGSPDPHGNYFKGTDRHWQPSYKPTKQIFIHHTVMSNYQADPSAAVRAIWDFHTNTRGWGDIGYNYLVDHHGNVYQGRVGGDNVVGGHVSGYNGGSLGVALMGCFDSQNQICLELNGGAAAPSAQVFDGLTSLLSNKATGFEIDPWGSNVICDVNNQNCLNLPTITGHSAANNTSCPGDLTATKLQEIRNTVKAKNDEGWTYSAKQLDYDAIDLSNTSSADVTVRFKNTGKTSWSNSSNRLSLYTMDPPARSSVFQGNGWLSSYQPAVLNEATVSPGGTGSFTFNLKRPNIPPGNYYEGYTLITSGGTTPGTYFTLPVKLNCTIGGLSNPRPNGILIKEQGTGKIYVIESGKKRYITAPLAAATHGFNLSFAHTVSSAETNSLDDGPLLRVKEGTLLKSSSSPSVYIIDETASGFERRYIPSASVMDAFGLKVSQVRTISQSALSAYAAGSTLQSSSAIPDGRLVKTSTNPGVYLVQDGGRRLVGSVTVFNSHGFKAEDVNIVDEQRIGQLVLGNSFDHIRSGTILKSANSPTVYGVDTDDGTLKKRHITTPYALIAAGYRPEVLVTISDALLDTYANSASLVCYK